MVFLLVTFVCVCVWEGVGRYTDGSSIGRGGGGGGYEDSECIKKLGWVGGIG